METSEYKALFETEEFHWWFKGLRDLVFYRLRKSGVQKRPAKILDQGCGAGYMMKRLDTFGAAFGLDLSGIALAYCKERGLSRLVRSSVVSLPFKGESLDAVISIDVMCLVEPGQDAAVIAEAYRVLKRGGLLIMHEPAHEYLRRAHDKRIHTRHRYSLGELREKIDGSNFSILKASYRCAFLWPVVMALSLKNTESALAENSELKTKAGFLDTLLYGLLRLENLVLRVVNLPIGTSVFCVARKMDGI